MSLFAEYTKELLGKGIVEEEWGFATFSFLEDGCYIENIYVSPEVREQGKAFDLADRIAVIAKERGCKYLFGSIIPSSNNPTRSMKVLLAYGFEVFSAKENFIFLRKEICPQS